VATVSNLYKDSVFDERLYSWSDIDMMEGCLEGLAEMLFHAWQGGDGKWVPEAVEALRSRVRSSAQEARQVFNTAYAREEPFVEEDSWQARWIPVR